MMSAYLLPTGCRVLWHDWPGPPPKVLCSSSVSNSAHSSRCWKDRIFEPSLLSITCKAMGGTACPSSPDKEVSLWAAVHQTQPVFQESLSEQSTSQSPFRLGDHGLEDDVPMVSAHG